MSNNNNNIIWNKYLKEGFIGKGRYGNVYKVKDKNTQKIYAIKEINKIDISEIKFKEEIYFIKNLV